jgi:WD40 repeat protein
LPRGSPVQRRHRVLSIARGHHEKNKNLPQALPPLFILLFLLTLLHAIEKSILQIDTGGHKAKIRDVIFTNDGRYLVPASDNKTVRFWDVESGETVRVLRGQIGHGSCMEVVVQQSQTPDQLIGQWTASNQRIRNGLASEITETEIDQELQAHRAAE